MDKMKKQNLSIVFLVLFIISSCTSDVTIPLGQDYFYRDEGGNIKDILCERTESKAFIPATIIAYKYNNNYIIARQRPILPQDVLYDRQFEYRKGLNHDYYWIIIKDKDSLYGPLETTEYKELFYELMIPHNLDVLKNN